MTSFHRRFVMCPPENVAPVVPAFLRRCADCPTRVWVAAVVLEAVVDRGEAEPLCFPCAHRAIRLSEITPAVAVLREYEQELADSGSLERIRQLAEGLNTSRLAMETYAAQMERTYCR